MLILTTLSALALSALLNVSLQLLHPLWHSETHNTTLFGSKDNILKCVRNNREYYADILSNCKADTCMPNEVDYCASLFQYMTDDNSELNFQLNRMVIIDSARQIVDLVIYNVDSVDITDDSPPWHFSYHPTSQTMLVSDFKIYPKSMTLHHKSTGKSVFDYRNLIGSSISLDLDIFATKSTKSRRYNNDSVTNHICDIMPDEFSYENKSFLVYSGIQYDSKILLYLLDTCKVGLAKIHLSEQIAVNEFDEYNDLIYLNFNDQIHLVTEVRDFPSSMKNSSVLISTIEAYLEIVNHAPLHYYSSMGMNTVLSDSFFCDYTVNEFNIAIVTFLDTINVIHAFWRRLVNQSVHTGKSSTLNIHALFATSSRHDVRNKGKNNSECSLHERKKHIMNKRNYDIAVSDGLVHVLLFVLPEQLKAAQEIVHSWRHNCFIKQTCAMYSRYYINLVLPDDIDEYIGLQMSKSGSRCNRNFTCFEILEKAPSIRSSLLQVDGIINYFVTPLDVVVILVGMEAILSFPQPAVANNGTTLIPYVSFGGHALYGLKNDIVFGNYDMRTIAGVGTSIKYMVRSLKLCERDESSPLSESSVLKCFVRYVSSNPEIIVIDDGHIFNLRNKVAFASTNEACILPIDSHNNAYHRNFDYFESAASMLDLLSADRLALNCSNVDEPLVHDVASLVIGYVSENIPQGRWDSCCSLIVRLYESLIVLYERDCLSSQAIESVIHSLLSKFVQLGLSSKYYNFMTSLEEYKRAADIISRAISNIIIRRKVSTSVVDNMHNSFVEAAWSSLANIYQELGPVEKMSMAIASSTSNYTQYNAYKYRKEEWVRQRSSAASRYNTVHIITAASEDTIGLKKLRLSALIAGVKLNIVGLGRKYGSYYDKILWYYEYLHEEKNGVNDDHIVLLIDAYDVLLFPSIRRIGKVLNKSPAPIVACTEHGSHPEMSAAFLYPRGYDVENNLYHDYIALQRYLNSGCIAGRAGQMKELLHYAMSNGKTLYDDQMLYTRYMLARPDQIHLDINSQIFLTTHAITKQQNSSFFLLPDFNLVVVINRTVIIKEDIAVLHANNMGNIDAASVYGILSSDLERRYNDHLSGPDGALLLQVLHLLWDNDSSGTCAWNTDIYRSYFTNPFKTNSTDDEVRDNVKKEYLFLALDKLKHPIIVSNMTKNGGRNDLGESLLQVITLKIHEC